MVMVASLPYSTGLTSCTNPDIYTRMEHELFQTDNNRTVDIRLGDTARISLPENATTGYCWTIDHYDKQYISALATEPHYTADGIGVGSGGNVTFIFQGKKIGIGEIALKHWRSWEGDSSIIARYHSKLNVLP